MIGQISIQHVSPGISKICAKRQGAYFQD